MASATKVGLTEKQRYWLGHLRQCEERGQSLAVYAKECGLDLKNLYRWKSVLAQRRLLGSSLPGFTPYHYTQLSQFNVSYCIFDKGRDRFGVGGRGITRH